MKRSTRWRFALVDRNRPAPKSTAGLRLFQEMRDARAALARLGPEAGAGFRIMTFREHR